MKLEVDFQVKFSEIQDDMDNNNIIMDKCKQYILDRCNNKLLNNKIDKFLKHDKIWSSKKCLKYGLVTKIV